MNAFVLPKTIVCTFQRTEYTEACRGLLHAGLSCSDLDWDGDLRSQLEGVELVIEVGGHSHRQFIDLAVDAKLWQVVATGLDNCEVRYILDKGIQLSHTPGFTSALGLSECAMMYILMLTRKYHQARENFDNCSFFQPSGMTLDGLTLGIIGYGASGRQLARRAKSFGMRIHAVDVRPLESDLPAELQPDDYSMASQLDSVLPNCDVVSLHLHLTPETRHIIDARRLAKMKPTAMLINVARGALIDEQALADAMLSGQLAGAGIDVFATEPPDPTRPEYQLPNFIVTPHTSGQTDETVRRRCQIAVENAHRLASGQPLLHLVDAGMGLGKT